MAADDQVVNYEEFILVPVPLMMPFGVPIDNIESIKEIWHVFVSPAQKFNRPQSVEMRALMAVIRSYGAALDRVNDPVKGALKMDYTVEVGGQKFNADQWYVILELLARHASVREGRLDGPQV